MSVSESSSRRGAPRFSPEWCGQRRRRAGDCATQGRRLVRARSTAASTAAHKNSAGSQKPPLAASRRLPLPASAKLLPIAAPPPGSTRVPPTQRRLPPWPASMAPRCLTRSPRRVAAGKSSATPPRNHLCASTPPRRLPPLCARSASSLRSITKAAASFKPCSSMAPAPIGVPLLMSLSRTSLRFRSPGTVLSLRQSSSELQRVLGSRSC